MRKGVLGINLAFYPVLSFLFLLFSSGIGNQMLLCGLLLGFVMLVEKDEWTTRQCMQALFLGFFIGIGDIVAGGFSAAAYSFTGWLSFIGTPFAIIGSVISFVFWVLKVVFALMALFRVAKGQEGRVPVVGKYADKAYGIIRQPVAPPQPQYNPGYPQQQPPMGQQQPPMGQQPAPMAPQQPPMGQQPAPMAPQQPPAPPAGQQPPPPAPPTV